VSPLELPGPAHQPAIKLSSGDVASRDSDPISAVSELADYSMSKSEPEGESDYNNDDKESSPLAKSLRVPDSGFVDSHTNGVGAM
jgi:hypothetical protein